MHHRKEVERKKGWDSGRTMGRIQDRGKAPSPSKGGSGTSKNNNPRVRKPPKTSAVAVRGRNIGVFYADILRKARSGVSLGEIGVENTRIRKGIGAILIQIPGSERQNSRHASIQT